MNHIITTAATVILGAVAALSFGCTDAQAKTESHSTATIAWVNPQSAYCSRGCTGLAAWLEPGRVADDRLREAIFVVSAYVPELREILKHDAGTGVRIIVAEPSPGAGADYDPRTHLIRMSPDSVQTETAVLASTLAHELVHGAQDSPAACQHEVAAYAWQAFVWERLQSAATSFQAYPFFDELTRAWHEGWLPRLVASWPLYRHVC